jgi:propanol-preferring alcohol dehydrogenase
MAQDAIAERMRAVVFEGVSRPLRVVQLPVPRPKVGELLLSIHACGVCRTDLHLLDGEVPITSPPRVLGHQIVATVVERGDPQGAGAAVGDRVGVPWLGWSDGSCKSCLGGRENLCPNARFTGCDIDGGMAEYAVADERFCFAIPRGYPDTQAAPLMCAGLIGYRALSMCGPARTIGLYGFGAAAHILTQVAVHQGREVYAFTRPGDERGRAFALELGASWAGSSAERPPVALDAAIIFAPDGALVPVALRALAPGETVVCGGIHMSDIPSFPYADLWHERIIRSVANLTRADAAEFLALAPEVPVRTTVNTYPLEAAAEALEDLRSGRFNGAAVLVP